MTSKPQDEPSRNDEPIGKDELIRKKDALHTASRASVMHAREKMLVHAKGPVDRGKDLGLWFPLGVRTFAQHVRDLLDRIEEKTGKPLPVEVKAAFLTELGADDVVYVQVPESEVLPMIWMLGTSYFGYEGADHFQYRDGMLPQDLHQFRPGQRAELPKEKPEERPET